MPTFNLGARVTVSAYTIVEADTLEQAIEIARERQVVLGGIASGSNDEEQWVIEDADGTPVDIGQE